MKKHSSFKGFVLGFLVCALLLGSVTYADDIYSGISVLMDEMNIVINGKETNMKNFVYNGTTYVPIREAAGYFGKVVDYDSRTNTISVMDKEEAQILSREIAFLVNGQPVRVNFFTQMINWYKLNSGGYIPGGADSEEFKDFVKGEVIAMEITKQYADSLGIILFGTDLKEIDKTIEIYAGNYGGMESFKKLLRDNGITYEVYYEIQKNYLLRSKLADVMTDEITNYELIDYYYDNIDSYAVEKVSAKQIFMSTTDDAGYALSAAVVAEKERKMLDIYDKIKSGEASFDEMMFANSEDSGLKAFPDGYTFRRGEMVKAFENQAFSLEPGEMSEVFESELGYHIILVTDRISTHESFEIVRESIYNSLRNEAYYKVVEPQISDAHVIINEDIYNEI